MTISVRNVTKIFNRNRPGEFLALDDVSLSILEGETTVFKGPSGSGKTTLLSVIGCMAKPTAGRVFVHEQEVSGLPERFRTQIRRKIFGFIFQQFHLIRGISTLENVMLPAYTSDDDYAALKKRALGLLDTFDLSAKADSKIEWLSGGEAQRVAIARALINDPAVIVADEPTAHLDTKLSLDFMGFMETFKKQGKTILFASHDPLVCDSAMIDKVIEMRDGRLQPSGLTA